MTMEIEDRKDKRMSEFVRVQEKTIDEWSETMRLEREARDRYFAMRDQTMLLHNLKNRCLTVGGLSMIQSNEFAIYGTQACPYVQSSELKNFVQNHIFGNPCPSDIKDDIMDDMFGLFDDMSVKQKIEKTEMKFDYDTPLPIEDNFIEMNLLNDFMQDVEQTTDIQEELISCQIAGLTLHCPYDDIKANWIPFRKDIKSYFVPPPDVPNKSYKMEFTSPFLLEGGVEEQKDTIDMVLETPDRYGLKECTIMRPEDVVGSGDETVSSTLKHRFRRKHFLKKMKKIIKNEVKKRFIQSRMSAFSARIILSMFRVHRDGFYTPDSMIRYCQDTKFKRDNPGIDPPSRRLFKNLYFGNKLLTTCDFCQANLLKNDPTWERAHIIPSKSGKLGSNGKHNFLICCKSCNTKTGDMDPYLHPDFRFTIKN